MYLPIKIFCQSPPPFTTQCNKTSYQDTRLPTIQTNKIIHQNDQQLTIRENNIFHVYTNFKVSGGNNIPCRDLQYIDIE